MQAELSPKQIVAELDRFIIGQSEAKKAVAIALRNRYRRNRLPEEVRQEITPKNIIMKGPTGVGKTEIARRLAKLVKAPFIKVEATKFTEVGYVGRDVESMIRDLVETSVHMVKEEKMAELESTARADAERKIVEILLKERKNANADASTSILRTTILESLRAGREDDKLIEIEVNDPPKPIGIAGIGGMDLNLGDLFGAMGKPRRKLRTISVKEAMRLLIIEESEKHLDNDAINTEALKRAEQEGIIFIDEIDKITARGSQGGPDVSREGVQRDILPIVEGSTVQTKYGSIKTDFILFIASGAFMLADVSDLIPELQGRFPIRVNLGSLTFDDFVKILTLPENAITKQYASLLSVDNINLSFTDGAIRKIAEITVAENETMEDIGARRLQTVIESVLAEISFNANGNHPLIDCVIDEKYVTDHLSAEVKTLNLKKYIL
ncbi:MAG: ATP-dependent protease ATPase subunit HslU [Clostridia bacterium]|nr:ATP-dependent protease ATPase subunit HslU [Clostridia bacterium]MBP5649286.1 ATP-dependent protease ATPase subunit HslU [Clostridia bacterium]